MIEFSCGRQIAGARAREIFLSRKADYDLWEKEAILDMLNDARPNLIIHLAATVGGIGANRVHQAEQNDLWFV